MLDLAFTIDLNNLAYVFIGAVAATMFLCKLIIDM